MLLLDEVVSMVPSTFFNIFATSPIKPLQKHIDEVFRSVKALAELISLATQRNWHGVEEKYYKVHECEGLADGLKKEIRLHLPTSLFMPVSRSDILELLSTQDKIANKAKDIAGVIYGRQMVFPQNVAGKLTVFVNRCVDATRKAHAVIYELDSLLETGFRGQEVEIVESMVQELDQLERETDALQVDIRRTLFEQEKGLPPIDVMFMYRVLEMIGELADGAQRVGHRLQQLVAH